MFQSTTGPWTLFPILAPPSLWVDWISRTSCLDQSRHGILELLLLVMMLTVSSFLVVQHLILGLHAQCVSMPIRKIVGECLSRGTSSLAS